MALVARRHLLPQIGRFGAVGALATLVHVVVAGGLNYGVAVPPLAANALAFLVAFVVSYSGHFVWTFGVEGHHRQRLGRFLAVSAATFALQQVIVWLVVDGLQLPFLLAVGLTVLILPALTFVALRAWIFVPFDGRRAS